MNKEDIVIRYNAEGKLIQRLPLQTMLNTPKFCEWYNEASKFAIVQKLNTGHSQLLPDGGWIEMESRHV